MPGVPELLIIMVILIVLFGGKKIAQLGKDLGSSITGFRSAMKEVEDDST